MILGSQGSQIGMEIDGSHAELDLLVLVLNMPGVIFTGVRINFPSWM